MRNLSRACFGADDAVAWVDGGALAPMAEAAAAGLCLAGFRAAKRGHGGLSPSAAAGSRGVGLGRGAGRYGFTLYGVRGEQMRLPGVPREYDARIDRGVS